MTFTHARGGLTVPVTGRAPGLGEAIVDELATRVLPDGSDLKALSDADASLGPLQEQPVEGRH